MKAKKKPSSIRVASDELLGRMPTPAQRELLEAMRRDVVVHFVSGLDAHYFRNDSMKPCTKQAQGLEDRGLVTRYDQDWTGYKLRPNGLMSRPAKDA